MPSRGKHVVDIAAARRRTAREHNPQVGYRYRAWRPNSGHGAIGPASDHQPEQTLGAGAKPHPPDQAA